MSIKINKEILYEFTIDKTKIYRIYTNGELETPEEDKNKFIWVNNYFPTILLDYFLSNFKESRSPEINVTEPLTGA